MSNLRHGYTGTRLHNIWRGILKRCNYMNNDVCIQDYALRGIFVCEEWYEFEVFCAWAEANGYTEDLSIDRIDNDDGYYPENCRWTTRTEQARNRRSTRWIEHEGETKSLAEWCEITGITPSQFHGRVARGWPELNALELVTQN